VGTRFDENEHQPFSEKSLMLATCHVEVCASV